MLAGGDGFHADQITRHEKSRDLLVPVVVVDAGFQKSAVDDIQRYQCGAGAMHELMFFSVAGVRSGHRNCGTRSLTGGRVGSSR